MICLISNWIFVNLLQGYFDQKFNENSEKRHWEGILKPNNPRLQNGVVKIKEFDSISIVGYNFTAKNSCWWVFLCINSLFIQFSCCFVQWETKINNWKKNSRVRLDWIPYIRVLVKCFQILRLHFLLNFCK